MAIFLCAKTSLFSGDFYPKGKSGHKQSLPMLKPQARRQLLPGKQRIRAAKPHFKVAITVWGRPWGIKTSSATLWGLGFTSPLKEEEVADFKGTEPCDEVFAKPRDIAQMSLIRGQGHTFQSCSSKNKRSSTLSQHMFLAISAGSLFLYHGWAILFYAGTGCAIQNSLPSSAQQISHLPDGSKERSMVRQPAATFCRPALMNTALLVPWPCICPVCPMGSAGLGHYPLNVCLSLWACTETLSAKRELQPHKKQIIIPLYLVPISCLMNMPTFEPQWQRKPLAAFMQSYI